MNLNTFVSTGNSTYIFRPLILLGLFRALILQKFWESAFCEPEDGHEVLDDLRHFLRGVNTVASSIGLSFDAKDIVHAELSDLDAPVDFLLGNALLEESMSEAIRAHFGTRAAAIFMNAQVLGIIRILSSLFHYSSDEDLSNPRNKHVKSQREKGREALIHIGDAINAEVWSTEPDAFNGVQSLKSVIAARGQSKEWQAGDFNAVFEAAEIPLNAAVPHYHYIEEQKKRADELLAELDSCKPGMRDWKKFEDICFRSLILLFVPPFKKVTVQCRDAAKLERRDAILANNQFTGFWNTIRDEFDCRHIVCEFKNGRAPSKNDLNQLRIYLSKPTIGRFGFLIHRGEPTNSLLLAQRSAYEQSKILVLLINEEALVKLFSARIFLGSADSVLDDMKTDFEIRY